MGKNGKKNNSRRNFLRALGLGAAAGAALPYIPLMNREVHAADGFPQRLLFIVNGNGTVADRYWPSGGAGPLDLSSSPILAPLAEFQDRSVLIRGLNHEVFDVGPGKPHPKAKKQLFTGRPLLGDGTGNSSWPGETVDQFIARTLRERAMGAGQAPAPVLSINAQVTNGGGAGLQARGPGEPVNMEKDPRNLYDNLFSSLVTEEDSGPDPAVLRRLGQRSRVFEAVASRLRSLENGVGVDGRRKIEAHLASLAEAESTMQGLVTTRGGGCVKPEPDFGAMTGNLGDWQNYPLVADLQGSLIADAFACDLSRVGMLWYGTHVPEWLGDLPIDEGAPAGIHGLAHKGTRADKWGPEFYNKHVELEQWRVGKILNLLRHMDAIPEGAGSLLDNTMVVWTSDMAEGNHNKDDVPVLIMGGGGGALETGRYLHVGGKPYQHLLASLCRLMGIDVSSYGHSDFAGHLSEVAP